MEKQRKDWEKPVVQSLSIKDFTLGGPGQGQPEGSKPGKGLGGDGSGPGASS